ncbi:ABC transporter ATP-binding protein [Pseudogracilibacillus sp. SE30717A]|uniref:ABC transporter ATP-binding protein n=1 Tax=Pseudogracilibacillus sp. SE30717A TaxID=3098293 RepID=UPI00300E1941
MSTLIFDNITKKYGNKTVVNNFNAKINQNELITIVGPSGCGKTTTLRMIAGFVEPTTGIIKVGDQELVNKEKNHFLEPEKREIGMVFQSYAVWPHMDVFKNVSYPLKIRKVNKSELARRTREVLKLVHLEKYENSFVHELSGGQQQRVALARALVMEPQLLLLDEPLSNLDAALRESMRSEIKEIQRKLDVTIINVTHDQIEAMTMSDRVIIMDHGNIKQIGTPEEIYNDPADSFVAKFIGSANLLDCHHIKTEGSSMTIKVLGVEMDVNTKDIQQKEGKLCVRPHHIVIDNSSHLIGKIVRRLYQGDRVEFHIETKGQVVRMITDAKEKYKVDDKIGIKFVEGIWLDN